MKQVSKLTGPEKAAILLMCLGEKATAKIFEQLSDAEVRSISRCMMALEHIPQTTAQAVLTEYKKAQEEIGGIFMEGSEFVRNAISASENRERMETLMEQVISGTESRPLETISLMEPRMVASLIKGEHPQTIALILSTQKPELTSAILNFLPESLKGEVMYRIAKIEKVSPEVIAQIEEALQREIGGVSTREQRHVGGLEKVVEVLGRVDKGSEVQILSVIQDSDEELAEEIRKRMFTFEDLAELNNRALQLILREVSTDSLTMALKTASSTLREKIFSNISERAAEMIEEDLDAMGPVRLSEVEKMQQAVIKVALKLEEEGQVVIPGRGGQDVLV